MRSLRIATVAGLLVLCASVMVAATRASGPMGVAEELPRADDASGTLTGVPDYTLNTFKGTELRLSSLRGRVVLLDFFNANCPHCRKHAPFIANLAKRYRDRGLVVLNLCAHNPYVDREIVADYIRTAGIENDVVWAPFELFSAYMTPDSEGRLGVPQTIIFGTDGRVAGHFVGWEEEKTGPQIEQAVLKQLDSQKVNRK